jgi:hypothetical protein
MPDNTTDTTDPPAKDDTKTPEPDTDGKQPDDGDDDGDSQPDAKQLAERLRAERSKRRKADVENADLRKAVDDLTKKVKGFEDRDKSEDQKRTEALDAAKAERDDAARERDEARLELLRHEVAGRKGIPEWFERLRGDTEEELEEDADRLIEKLPTAKTDGDDQQGGSRPRKRPAPDTTLGRGTEGKPSTADQFASAIGPML